MRVSLVNFIPDEVIMRKQFATSESVLTEINNNVHEGIPRASVVLINMKF